MLQETQRLEAKMNGMNAMFARMVLAYKDLQSESDVHKEDAFRFKFELAQARRELIYDKKKAMELERRGKDDTDKQLKELQVQLLT